MHACAGTAPTACCHRLLPPPAATACPACLLALAQVGGEFAISTAEQRRQIEALLGTPVYLDLHVKVAKDWQRDPRQLRRLGF